MPYNGRLEYTELCELVERINNRVNSQVNQGIVRIPLLYFVVVCNFILYFNIK